MNYSILSAEQDAYAIAVGSDGHRWLAEVGPACGGLGVQVYGLADPPPNVIEAEIVTHPVGGWWVPAGTSRRAIARQVAALVNTLPRGA